jgi:predicted molibdopterin-dependent oxidoreductase YjgC
MLQLTVNGKLVSARHGATVAAVLMQAGAATRTSVSGEARNPFCAMGICMECCATVNGVQHVRTCQIPVEAGMEVVTE